MNHTALKTKARVITPEQFAVLPKELPKSWTNAIGILKGRNIDPVRYQRQIRKGWGKRLKKQIRLAQYGR